MPALVAGANTVLPAGPWVLAVPGPYDLSALVLGADGKVAGDADFVFWNQPATAGARLAPGAVTVDPRGLRPGAERVVVLVSPADGGPLGRLPAPRLTVQAGGREVAGFVAGGLDTETVAQIAELYRAGGRWKLRAVGQGYADGLAGLARDFGVVVDDEPPSGLPAWHDEVVALTNARRAEHRLPPLTVEPRLRAAAQAHNDDMVARGFFAHDSPEGASVADRVRATGYPYAVVAENLAAGQQTPAEVVQGWMDSPGHRANLLHPDVRQIGVGFTAGGSYGTTWTQVFGTTR